MTPPRVGHQSRSAAGHSGLAAWLTTLILSLTAIAAACAPETAALATPSGAPSATPSPSLPATPLPPTATAPPPPTPTVPSPISDQDWARGPETAPVTLVIYTDFPCAACARLAAAIRSVQARHPQDVRLVVRLFPLTPLDDRSSLAAQAALAADQVDQFWPLYDLLFENYQQWAELNPEAFEGWLLEAAGRSGLDSTVIEQALADGTFQADVERLFKETMAAGIPGTPLVYLNGAWFRLPANEVNLEAAVRLELLKSRQFSAYPPMDVDLTRRYRAYLVTNKGQIVIELYPLEAPLAVNSFLFLARQGWYDGTGFHLVDPGARVEGGDPSATGLGDAGYHFATEPSSALSFDRPGRLALVSTGPGSSSSRFFITLAPAPELDATRTIFGQVLQGLDLLQALPARQPLQDLLQPMPLILETIRVETE